MQFVSPKTEHKIETKSGAFSDYLQDAYWVNQTVTLKIIIDQTATFRIFVELEFSPYKKTIYLYRTELHTISNSIYSVQILKKIWHILL